ncbi:hypothetical protein ACLB2K_032352 [Fragaria x ananassa]
MKKLTRNVPRLTLVEVDFDHESGVGVNHLLHQIITDQLFISGMEPEPSVREKQRVRDEEEEEEEEEEERLT